MGRELGARQDRRMAPSRVVLLATLCAMIMFCAGLVQLFGMNRAVVADGSADISFRSDYFPLEQFPRGR
jgi:hypothetical protein